MTLPTSKLRQVTGEFHSPAIWIHESEKFELTRQLIDEYQIERAERLRKEYQSSRADGECENCLAELYRKPTPIYRLFGVNRRHTNDLHAGFCILLSCCLESRVQ